ncbi:MAG: 50S ribosome-binding GTPase [Lachnospiraceae bacterium]|nr:50S ribosome-binding GTPase [Lachnospiraceae bacterium]MDE6185147.1 50S ribosome-binding GTPase [Lachnospiraceae bacterium]MDE7286871.1 50S ribosome-binding GTPase [Lachnospiraceae bacterium]
MGKMIYLMGKSSSGKDTIYKRLLGWKALNLKQVVLYTTRPIRAGEMEGKEYHFTDDAGFMELKAQGKVIEARAYHTYHGLWRYFTVDDGSIDLSSHNYLIIGTIESYVSTAEYFGRDKVLPVLLVLDDGIRLKRALNREMQQEHPKYEEMCRRFLADAEDFSEEKIKDAGITIKFFNENLNSCLAQIKDYIKDNL